jgi:hypothetical protein
MITMIRMITIKLRMVELATLATLSTTISMFFLTQALTIKVFFFLSTVA